MVVRGRADVRRFQLLRRVSGAARTGAACAGDSFSQGARRGGVLSPARPPCDRSLPFAEISWAGSGVRSRPGRTAGAAAADDMPKHHPHHAWSLDAVCGFMGSVSLIWHRTRHRSAVARSKELWGLHSRDGNAPHERRAKRLTDPCDQSRAYGIGCAMDTRRCRSVT